MPITHNLTVKEELIISLLRSQKRFLARKREFLDSSIISSNFQEFISEVYYKYDYDQRYNLEIIAFRAEPIPFPYFENETELVSGTQKIRRISKDSFQEFIDSCSINEFLYFGFTHSSNHFNLGYVNQVCVDDCEFRGSNIDNIEDDQTYIDPKRKRGILHTKDEFSEFMRSVTDFVYLHKRQYKTGRGPIRGSKHTVVLSNSATVTSTSKLENKGGNCCPPQW